MRYLLFAGGALLVGLLLRRVFLSTPPVDLARRLRMAGGIALMLAGGGLLFLKQFMLGATLGLAGFMLLRREVALRSSGPS